MKENRWYIRLTIISGNNWFSTLDLKSGYWQIKIRSEDKEKTAFSIGNGLCLKCLSVFVMSPLHLNVQWSRFWKATFLKFTYLDNVIIFGKNFEEMLSNLEKIFFHRFGETNLKINPQKYIFFN